MALVGLCSGNLEVSAPTQVIPPNGTTNYNNVIGITIVDKPIIAGNT